MIALPIKLTYLVFSFYFLLGNSLFAQDYTRAINARIKTQTTTTKVKTINKLAYNQKRTSLAKPRIKEEKERLKNSNEKNNNLLEAVNQRYRVLRVLWLSIIILFLITIAYFLKKKEKQQNIFRNTFAKDGKSELIQRMRNEHNAQVIRNNLKEKADGATIDKVIKDLQLSSNNTFDEDFLMIYHKVDEEFFPKLRKKHPSLTKHDQVLCGMIKMGLDSKQIAHITFRSPESIHVARSRLRKKLAIMAKEDLGLYIQRI
ncbi:MAG: hypothetical protein K9J27_00080 [Bacteroidales bacterium]|nr:hypothetical protein [Bacteroidales bacterium]MCF8333345.1 hypothetical protein [Bacteroidales bacterium]